MQPTPLQTRAAYLLALAQAHSGPHLAPPPVHTKFCATVAGHQAHAALSRTLAGQRARQWLQAGPQAHVLPATLRA